MSQLMEEILSCAVMIPLVKKSTGEEFPNEGLFSAIRCVCAGYSRASCWYVSPQSLSYPCQAASERGATQPLSGSR